MMNNSKPSAPQLIIFDCDGVLVDSEGLMNQVWVDALAEQGLMMTVEEAIFLFRGRKMAECVADVEARLGGKLPLNFVPDYRSRTAEVFRTDLKPIPFITEALDRISIPSCVASSGPTEKINLALEVTGLLPRFEGRLFSAYEVGVWKPDPGLFLHAAKMMEVPASECIVIEDSVPGVQAGIAAGMHVLGYAAVEHDVPLLASQGAHVFRSMQDLPAMLGF